MTRDLNPDWIIPSWPAPANVRAVCTTRAGGASNPPFDTMNLGDHVGDDLDQVAHNRALLRDAIHATPVFLTQVHGVRVVEHGPQAVALSHKSLQADACITRHPGVVCTIMVADCLPVLFTNRQGTVVGAAHAGWRGLAGGPDRAKAGILEAIYHQFMAIAPVSITQLAITIVANDAVFAFTPSLAASVKTSSLQLPQAGATEPKADINADMLVWLGPCIGPDRFEVGDDVRDAFVALDALAQTMFKPYSPGKWLADLAGLARLRLRAMGIQNIYGNDGSTQWCTASNPSRFFSHRRDAVALGGSGRMAACIWLA